MSTLRTEHTIAQLDQTLCFLRSMGHVLVQLGTADGLELDHSSIADLGRVIQEKSIHGLEILEDLSSVPAVARASVVRPVSA